MDNLADVGQEISKFIKFSDVSRLFEKILKAQTHNRKCEILKTFIESFRQFRDDFKNKNENANSSFYPLLRLVLPQSDRERDSYGIQVTSLGKLYVRVLAVEPHGDVAKKLTTIQGLSNNYLDYADVVYDVMKNRCSNEGTLTVYDVNEHLNEIAICYQNNRRKKIDDELIKMINGMTAIDQKWLIRIILKNLRLGIGKQKIFALFHPSAYAFYGQYSNLSRVCECIENGDELPSKGTVEPFQPVRSMLCERINIGNLQSLLNKNEYFLETKMDGERFQIHIKNEKYRYFSRNGYDYTKEFGKDNTFGTLTPFLCKLFQRKFENAIFDGEMMVWNKEEMIYHTKGENFDVKNLRKDDSTLRPAFCVYDIIYLDNNSLTIKPYAERRRLLESIIIEKEGYLKLCKSVKIKDNEHILKQLNQAIDDKEEGVVIKNIESYYRPGERNGGWCKIKPDYIDGLISDFDLIIIGGYYNRRKTYIDSYLMAVFKKDADNLDTGKFFSCAHVSLGLTFSQRLDINNKLKIHWQTVQVSKEGRKTISYPPACMEWGTTPPDVWIDPKNSIILEIKASELVKTNSFRTNYTLRFPRIVSVRSDKLWYDCCTLDEFDKLCSSNSKVEKITKRHITNADINEPTTSKRTRNTNRVILPSIQDNMQLKNIAKIDNACNQLEFCILSGSKTKPVKDLKELIVSHGGRTVENPGQKTYACIAGINNFKVKSLVEKRIYNIATVDWLINALNGKRPAKHVLQFHPLEMLSTTMELEKEFLEKFDSFGDSYQTIINAEELYLLFSKMDANVIPNLTKRELFETEKELNEITSTNNTINIFRLYTAYFYQMPLSKSNDGVNYFTLSKYIFQYRGGTIINEIIERHEFEKLTHLIVSENSLTAANQEHLENKFGMAYLKNVKLISYQWILDCDNNQKLNNDKNYILKIN